MKALTVFPWRRILPLVLLILVSVPLAVSVAQEPSTGQVLGRVSDPSGGVIPGADLTLTMEGRERPWTAVSDDAGQYKFKELPAGKYEIEARLTGFKTYTAKFVLAAGEERRVDITLQLGEITEAVTVSGGVAPVHTEAASVSSANSGVFRIGRAKFDPQSRWNPNFNTEAYDHIDENDFIHVSDQPLSTFSIDVDTASYSNVRRFLKQGQLPPKDAVRIEELINYFNYDLIPPQGRHPFEVSLEMAEAPWNPEHRLLSIGIQGRRIPESERPPGNFVFLIDVSGSMQSYDKLPLLKKAMRFMVDRASSRDRIAMVVYAGAAGQVLAPTSGDRKTAIIEALEGLQAGGSTNGGEGIKLAYDLAARHFQPQGINRIILATDGDFNVGVTNQGDLTRLIQEQAKRGIFLTVLGFGTGNLKDSTMEKLADKGNGNYAYIDSLLEARKVLAEELGATLVTIAKDVKIQAEFNPLRVEAFRLLGYENRLLEHRDFNDDSKDAGEIGAGHSLMVLYELIPFGEGAPEPSTDPLRYQDGPRPNRQALSQEWMNLKLRYKRPDEEQSRLIEIPVGGYASPFLAASPDLRFSAAVAAFGMLLRESPHCGIATYQDALSWARDSLGSDPGGYRQGFLQLVDKAAQLSAGEETAMVRRR
ncbi:MAG TPA: von Willebrand factor type A domain-containing protein [Acidobacteriota bacterium]|nr:von Willebrand factor type A domain-containing protein [Acidobacteriota bacterium]